MLNYYCRTRFPGHIILVIALAILAFTGADFSEQAKPVGDNDSQKFGMEDLRNNKEPLLTIPEVTLSAKEVSDLATGKHITRMLDADHGGKMGWMRFIVEADPVTLYYILTDNESYTMESPEYPPSGPSFSKKRTFMPYTWENIECRADNKQYLYQLLVLPLVSPRQLHALLQRDTDGFPWELVWTESEPHCIHLADPALADWRKMSVLVERNRGSWLISPIPDELRQGPNDLYRTDLRYFVDTNPGGAIGKIDALANGAQRQAMPTMAKLINHHAATYQRHMEKFKTPEYIAEFKKNRAAYLEKWESIFNSTAKKH